MSKYEYKYVAKILIGGNSPYDIFKTDPEDAEKALNDLGSDGWKFVGSTQSEGTTVAWIFSRKIKKD